MLNDIFNIMLPQFSLGGFIILLLVLSMVLSPRVYKYARLISITGIAITTILLSTVQIEPQYFGFQNSIMADSYTLLFDFVILLSGFLVSLLSKNLIKTVKRHAYTFHAILLTAILGAISAVSANDFLTLLVSVELLGFSTYFLISVSKGYYSKQAAFKYLITSAVSTGIFLFGVSYLYGICGSINFSYIYEFITKNDVSILYSLSAILIILGLVSKLAVFPFANWIIDVYKNSETSALAFLSSIPKLAMFGIICRLIVFPLSNSIELTFVVCIVALVTAFWANTYAIRENNVKAILACSASANSSYAILTASLVSVYNLSTVIFYLICYTIMNIGAFAFLNMLGENNSFELKSFQGLYYKNKKSVLAFSLILVGLAGLPITSGFIAKIYLFSAIANSGFIFLTFLIGLLILNIIAVYYYLKILFPMFSDNMAEETELKINFSQRFVLCAAAIITLVIGLYPETLIKLCRLIAYNI